MATYIIGFIGIIPHKKSVILQYCNLTDFLRGMIGINPLMYVAVGPNSEPPRSDPKP